MPGLECNKNLPEAQRISQETLPGVWIPVHTQFSERLVAQQGTNEVVGFQLQVIGVEHDMDQQMLVRFHISGL